MYWENDRGNAAIPLRKAEEIFDSQYGFTVAQFPILLKDSIDGVQQELLNYQSLISSPDCLVIIYYVGHGKLNLDMQYHLYTDRNLPEKTLKWSTLQSQLMSISADVLVIVESCEAASMALSIRNEKKREGRMEVIAASTYPDVTWSGGGPESFNSALCEALGELAVQGNIFTSATLYHEILLQVFQRLYAKKVEFWKAYPPYYIENHPYIPSSPIHLNLTGNLRLSSIQLTPLRPQTQTRLLRQLRQNVNPYLDDFDLDWPRLEDDEALRRNWNGWNRVVPL
ncbi:hypothetical protein N431DRAFT_450665 [Stipitochalara longipes BDJ]|nr:hypothetical protein N431DRAFT_450665 [Stipitochalara longipes BDJ]